MDIDPELLRTLNSLDAETRKRLLAYEGDLKKALAEHTRGKSIVDQSGLFKKIVIASGVFGVGFGAALLSYNKLAARRALESDNKLLLDIMIGAGAKRKIVKSYLDNQLDRTVQTMGNAFMNRKFPGTELSVINRIKTVSDGSQTVVRNIISMGIKDGKSPWQIAREIGAYVTPNENGLRVAPWTITRRELGKPVSYIPKGVPAGSVEYNAFRIARAETVETYQQAPYLAHKDKWYYQGVQWHLSRAHPKRDKCDDYADHDEGIGKGVWRKKPPLPHPHCICYTTTKTIDSDDLIKGLKLVNWR